MVNGFARVCKHSMKVFATGLSVRFFNVTTSIDCDFIGTQASIGCQNFCRDPLVTHYELGNFVSRLGQRGTFGRYRVRR